MASPQRTWLSSGLSGNPGQYSRPRTGATKRHDWLVASGSSPGWLADRRAIRLVGHDPGSPVDTSRWPATVPAVEQLLGEGLELPEGLTMLVGENGSGKST